MAGSDRVQKQKPGEKQFLVSVPGSQLVALGAFGNGAEFPLALTGHRRLGRLVAIMMRAVVSQGKHKPQSSVEPKGVGLYV